MPKLYRTGFTLVELMVSITLGLIVTAAAVMLFITGQQNYSLQKSAADIQDNANFGLSYIAKNIRQSNLNANTAVVDDAKLYSGIVLSAANFPAGITNGAYTTGLATSSNVNVSGVVQQSDQLVIQYLPVSIGGFDCEGNRINSTNDMIVERYFLRKDSNVVTNEAKNEALALACDAGSYSVSGGVAAISGFDGVGQIVMKRVDYFHVLFLVQNGIGQKRYMNINDYMNAGNVPRPRILSVQLGLLVRSAEPAGSNSQIDQNQAFIVLDQTVKANLPAAGATIRFLRQPLMQTVALRNALGDR